MNSIFFGFVLSCKTPESIPVDSPPQIMQSNSVLEPEPPKPSPQKKWNVIIITADTLRGDMLSSLGHPQVKTPNLDRIANEGINFTRAYTNITTTVPAHASLFSSFLVHIRSFLVDIGSYRFIFGSYRLIFGYLSLVVRVSIRKTNRCILLS